MRDVPPTYTWRGTLYVNVGQHISTRAPNLQIHTWTLYIGVSIGHLSQQHIYVTSVFFLFSIYYVSYYKLVIKWPYEYDLINL